MKLIGIGNEGHVFKGAAIPFINHIEVLLCKLKCAVKQIVFDWINNN